MTGSENLRTVLDGGKGEYTPCYFGNVSIMTSSAIHNKPQMGSKGSKDWWGVEWAYDNVNQSFSPAAGVEPVLKDIVNWKNELVFPKIDDIDWASACEKDSVRFDRSKVTIFIANNGLFERMHFLMGFENAVMAVMEEPEACAGLVNALADFYIRLIEKIGEYYKPEYLTFMDDYTYKNGLLVTYDAFDEIFAPALKRIVTAVEANGMKHIEHCCGKSELLQDRFYDLGIRRLDPCQPINDLVTMRAKHPDMVLLGGLDVQGIIDVPGTKEEEIRKDVRRCLETYGTEGRGYVVYGASVSLHDPNAYKPGGKLYVIMDEVQKYAKEKGCQPLVIGGNIK